KPLDAVRCERSLLRLEVGQDVAKVFRVQRLADPEKSARGTWVALHLPDAREIGLAVQARHRPGHVDLAVSCAWRAGHGMVYPLRTHGDASSETRNRNPEGRAKSSSHGCHLTTASMASDTPSTGVSEQSCSVCEGRCNGRCERAAG